MDKEDFIRMQTALKWSNVKMAKHLRKTAQSVSNYRTGRQAIPEHVKVMIKHALQAIRDKDTTKFK